MWGHRFTLRTDPKALTTLLSTKGINGAGMRIALGLFDSCDFNIMFSIIQVNKTVWQIVSQGYH